MARIGGRWGEVIKTEMEGEMGLRKAFGLVGVLTSKEEWICDTAVILIDNLQFKVRVMERIWDKLEIGEILESEVESESEFRSDAESRGWGLPDPCAAYPTPASWVQCMALLLKTKRHLLLFFVFLEWQNLFKAKLARC